MLGRNSCTALNLGDEGHLFHQHALRASAIKLQLDTTPLIPPDSEGVAYTPSCHAVARAYAAAFDVAYEDGWRHTILPTRKWLRWKPFYRYGHSWNVITIDSISVVLDLFPEETCSMLPIMMTSRDAIYYYHENTDQDQLEIDAHVQTPECRRVTDFLVEQFVNIDAGLSNTVAAA